MTKSIRASSVWLMILQFSLTTNSVSAQGLRSKVDPGLSDLYAQFLLRSQPELTRPLLAKPSSSAGLLTLTPAHGSVFSVNQDAPDPIVRVIMEYRGEIADLEVLGIDVQSQIGHLITAHFPISRLPLLAQREDVGYIELGKPVELLLDVSASKVRAPEARSAFGYKGQNVIIGIVDSGIDFTHQDFIKPDGTTRILYIWDQTLTPVAGESNPSQYSYGVEYTQAQINNEIDGTPAGFVRHRDTIGHGTHVTGIAAGNGRATGNNVPAGTYVGMAPEADLIIVRVDLENYANIIDGLFWIGTKASQLGRPWVANLSLGTLSGPKDGTSNFEQSIFAVTNQAFLGKGRIIVVAAGNEGHDLSDPNRQHEDRYHVGGNGTSTRTLVINAGDNPINPIDQTEVVWLEIWYPWADNYSVTLTSPLGHQYGPFSKGQGTGNPGQFHLIDDPIQTDGLVRIHNEHFGEGLTSKINTIHARRTT